MRTSALGWCCLAGLVMFSSAAAGQAISNPIAIFAGLDKITGTITTFEIEIDKAKRFGTLDVRPRICNTRPPTEEPKTTSFVEVDENLVNGGRKRVFSGWMLAESPGLNAVQHPVYDVWLTGCRDPNRKNLEEPLSTGDVEETLVPAQEDQQ